jgi:hypothetical protein
MQSLTKTEENLLLDGVKQAVDLVDSGGISPNEALEKVAKELNYSPGFLKAACNAFNTGRQTAQWEANDSILDKLASFPLADYSAIHAAIWNGEEEKRAAVSAKYLNPPIKWDSYEAQEKEALLRLDLNQAGWSKSASAEEPSQFVQDYEGEIRVKLAYNKVNWEGREVEESRRLKVAAEDQLNLKVHLLESYFKKFAYDRISLAQVEKAASIYYGRPGAALLDYVASKFPSEKRASDHQSTWSGFSQPVDRNAEPYTLIAECIKQAQVHNQMNSGLAEAEAKLAEAKEKYASFIQPQSSSNNGSPATLTPLLIEEAGEKQSSLTAGIAGGIGVGGAKLLADMSPSSAKRLENQIQELDDPQHLSELRKIKAQTLLTSLMSDTGDPISGYDPEEVLAAYNNIVQLAPSLADQPAAVGPLLRKKLMGNTEPFEVAEQLKLEESLKNTQAVPSPKSPTDLMRNEASIIS